MAKIKDYPKIIDITDSIFLVETSAGTRRMDFSQLSSYFQKTLNNSEKYNSQQRIDDLESRLSAVEKILTENQS